MTAAPTRRDGSGEIVEGMDLIDMFADHLAELRRAESTIETYIGALRDADATLPEGLICATEDELRTWLRARGWSKATAKLRTAILRQFYAFACDPRRIPRLDYNPAAYLPATRVPRRYPRPVPTEVLADVLRRANPRHRLCFTLAAFAGARCCEIAALDREDVTEVTVMLHGKGDKTRLVPCHRRIWEEVRELPPGPLVRGPGGERVTRRQVMLMTSRALDRLGYPQITCHQFRHWFGTHTHDAVPDLAAVQELLGHSSPATTRIYVQANRQRMAAAVAALPDL
jgi:integrase/recombinase XerC